MDPRLEFIHTRRSVRRYTGQDVDAASIRALLEAGFAAPSASDLRPCRFLVITARENLTRLAESYIHYRMLAEAALAIAVCAEPARSPDWWVQDASAATQNILLAASALGLGSVWLGVHPSDERKKFVSHLLEIPTTVEVLSIISIGHPSETPEPRSRYEDDWVHYDHW